MASHVCWLRSDLLREADGRIGSACLYQSIDPQALMEHARRVGLPCHEITPVVGRVVFRPPPPGEPAAWPARVRR
jgi:hypothetical protein